MKRTIICLANSRRPNGRCVAGLDDDGTWVRPVGAREGDEVAEDEQRYDDGTDAALLDRVEIELLRRAPSGHQTENRQFDSSVRWRRVGAVGWDEAVALASAPDALWTVEDSSSYHGLRERIDPEDMGGIEDSLRLIHVNDLVIGVHPPGPFPGARWKVVGDFTHLDVKYALQVSDPVADDDYLARGEGYYDVGEALLTVSLTATTYLGYHYKVIAGVITPDLAGGA